ncbi:uncharacterized protein LMH87_008075 [Akanthomyces muscarius]|uniref:Uncharacterized protein n=1 Tax=Akanthomyces muscarius TaxID=2231603 RepID=A0A9W8UMU5_AKAMU|nr:uncharacterized protein LMH87_008075 [Akanthomyces muscarius]KAJ4159163.1 hypothetical protein LMH87_008075 [Akanthomyces muscarius]
MHGAARTPSPVTAAWGGELGNCVQSYERILLSDSRNFREVCRKIISVLGMNNQSHCQRHSLLGNEEHPEDGKLLVRALISGCSIKHGELVSVPSGSVRWKKSYFCAFFFN